jgi:hypothetical protein
MRKFLFISFLAFAGGLNAQWLWDYGGTIGASNYLGDIGGKEKTRRDFIADMKLAKTRWNLGGFIRHKWRPRMSLKLAVDYIRLEGDDKLSSNPGRRYRNFNFRNDMFDAAFTGEYFFYENNDLGNTYRYRNGFRAYIFAGVGAFLNNPKTFYEGSWVPLRQYATEGYHYKALQLNIPMGVGFYFTFNKRHRFGFEMNYRKTFTDYIDDISGNYPSDPVPGYVGGLIMRKYELDEKTRLENMGAYNSHDWGMKRGEKANKDSYLTVSFSYSRVIRGKASFYRVRNTGFFSQKRRMRKIRAKF